MIQQFLLTLKARPKGFHLITAEVLAALPELPESGLLSLLLQHTSAGLALNENAAPDVRRDLDQSFDRLAPEGPQLYAHTEEGPDDMPAHVKTVLVGSTLNLPISNGRLNLGTWQGIYLCEFRRRAPERKLVITLLS